MNKELFDRIAGKVFNYEWVGLGSRTMEMMPDGTIGVGSAACEEAWTIAQDADGSPLLRLIGVGAITCDLKETMPCVWEGRWLIHQQHPVRMTLTDFPIVSKPSFWRIRPEISHGDRFLIHEVYYRDCYRLRTMDLPDAPIVLDVGGSIGVFSRLVLDLRPNARVFAFEPNALNHESFRINAPGATLIPKALHYGSDLRLLNSVFEGSLDTGKSYVTDPTSAALEKDSHFRLVDEPVPAITLEEFFAEHEIDRVDLAKFDCEGSEYSIFAGMTRDSAVKLRRMVGEYHLRESRFLEADKALSARVGIIFDFSTFGAIEPGGYGNFDISIHEVKPCD